MWAILLYTAVKAMTGDNELEDGQKLFIRANAGLIATPLFVVLVMIEFTDVIFAVDSVPAILSISSDPSSLIAILGLRALYLLLEAIRDRLVYLPKGLGVILFNVGVEMGTRPGRSGHPPAVGHAVGEALRD